MLKEKQSVLSSEEILNINSKLESIFKQRFFSIKDDIPEQLALKESYRQLKFFNANRQEIYQKFLGKCVGFIGDRMFVADSSKELSSKMRSAYPTKKYYMEEII